MFRPPSLLHSVWDPSPVTSSTQHVEWVSLAQLNHSGDALMGTQRTVSMVIPSLTKLTRKVNITDNRHPARCQGPKRQPSSPDIFQGSGYRLWKQQSTEAACQFAPTPVTFFSPQGSEGQATPPRNVAVPLSSGTLLIIFPFVPTIPHAFTLVFFLVLPWMEEEIRRQFILETVGPCVGFPSRLC